MLCTETDRPCSEGEHCDMECSPFKFHVDIDEDGYIFEAELTDN